MALSPAQDAALILVPQGFHQGWMAGCATSPMVLVPGPSDLGDHLLLALLWDEF
jgi:hypothetical protein